MSLALACLVAAGVFRTFSPYFFTAANLTTILQNSVQLLLISLGISFILATAGIDIAVGGVLGMSAIFIGPRRVSLRGSSWPPFSSAVRR